MVPRKGPDNDTSGGEDDSNACEKECLALGLVMALPLRTSFAGVVSGSKKRPGEVEVSPGQGNNGTGWNR